MQIRVVHQHIHGDHVFEGNPNYIPVGHDLNIFPLSRNIEVLHDFKDVVANLVLGAILFFSPWMFGFDAGKISENANITGLVIAIIAIAALAAFAVWEEWLNLIVGLWALVSPWVLGFQGTTAMTVHVVIGLAVAVLAAIELWIMSQNPPRLTTHS